MDFSIRVASGLRVGHLAFSFLGAEVLSWLSRSRCEAKRDKLRGTVYHFETTMQR